MDIKEIRKPKTIEQKRIFEEMDFLKKSLFIYRLIHFNAKVIDIETGMEGRDKELCKPLLQLFYNSKSQKRIERIFEILLDEKNNRKANSLERDILEVIISLFDIYYDGIVPFNEIWLKIIEKTNGTINEYKKHELETEMYGTIYKTTLSRMLRDKFGAKDPKTRNSNTRALEFDIEKIKNHLENYRKETPTKISCSQKVSDSNDSNDNNGKDLYDTFFASEPFSLINNEENNADFSHDALPKNENNAMGFPNAVTAVTAVTDEDKLDKQTDSNQENESNKQDQNISIKEFIGKDIANSTSYLRYDYTIEDIDSFFASNRGQKEKHPLEESICRPLIGQQNTKPYFYYCKENPKIENINLKGIEDHIRLKDPQIHKAKLLEYLSKKEEDF